MEEKNKITLVVLCITNVLLIAHTNAAETSISCYVDNVKKTFRCGNDTITNGKNTIAVGNQSSASGARSIAIGSIDDAINNLDPAFTNNTKSAGDDSISIGAGTTVVANAPGGIAIGSRRHESNGKSAGNEVNSGARVYSINGIAIGTGSVSGSSVVGKQYHRTIAIGDGAKVSGNLNTGLGAGIVVGDSSDSSVAVGFASAIGRQKSGSRIFDNAAKATAVGAGAEVMRGSDRSTSIGSEARVLQGTTQSIALGNNTTINIGGNNSTAVGSFASVGPNAANAIALGGGNDGNDAAKANAVAAIAVGHASSASGTNALALGSYSHADAEGAVIIGSGAKNTKGTLTAVGLPADNGINAIGIGSSAKSAANGIAIGRGAEAKISEARSIAIGDGAVSAGGIAFGQGASVVKGNNPSGTASASVAIGRQTTVADYGVALGSRASVGMTLTADGTPEKLTTGGLYGTAVGINSGVYSNSALAVGHNAKVSENANAALAVGYNSQSSAQNAIAIGNSAKATAVNTISIGTGNMVSGNNSGAIGDPSTVSGANSYSLGNNNTVSASNAFVLGSAVNNSVDNSVVLGNGSTVSIAVATPEYTVNGVSHTFSGSAPVSTVSIGDSGKERTLTNVAAGRISATSTDAINGSQLFAVTSEVEKGNQFAGNTGTFNRRLGETTTIRGGLAADAAASNKNIRTVAKDGQIDILLADNLDVTSVKTGGTLLNNDGLHITGGPSVTAGGINAGDRVISNVGDAISDTDAVNKRQLDNLSISVNRGWNIQANGGDAETVAPGDTVNVTEGDNIQVTRTGKTLNIATARKVNFDNVAVGDISLDKDTGKISGLSDGSLSADSRDAVTGSQLFNTNENVTTNTRNIASNKTQIDSGLNFTGNTGTFNRRLGETTTIRGGLAADAAASNKNIRTVAKDGQIDILLADNLDVTSVKTGGTLLNNDGLHITGGPSVTAGGINAGNRVISNVGDAISDTDAVNKRQLDNLSTIVGLGLTFSANEGNDITRKPGDILALKGDATTKGDYSGKNIKTVTDISTGMISIQIAESPVFGSVVINNNGKITGVSDGAIAAGSKEVVNGGQIHRFTTSVGNIIGGNAHADPDGSLVASNIGNTGKNTIHDAIDSVRSTAETASAGWNLSVNGQQSSAVKPKETVDLNNTDGNISITKKDNQVSFNLSDSVKVKESIGIENGPSLTRTGIDGAGMKITNVADGVIAAGSKDAVNGGQIHDFVSGEVTRPITFAADSGIPYDARLGTTVNVKGDDKNIRTMVSGNTLSVSMNENINVKSITATESLSVASGASVDMGGNAIHNVGNATRPGDAVNYGQFQQAFSSLGNQINRVERRANAGAAAAIATAGLTQAYIPGKSMMSMSGGTFQGESSLAIGLSTISDNGNWVLKGSFSSTTRNQTGASVGVGFQF
ncbi:YadA-like family protein [Salmonella enterica]|uniref:YadA-like family protein n=1 Tax=Salmonella enterica TaxID=28901 RepID=UPI0012B6A418|nr:YadA-like family protein [Salmonella enterica]